jgi:hypothetical protein
MAVVAPLPPLKKACVPRPEVLSGQIRDELFMASLSDVRRGKAHPIYQDPKLFFANTYPTKRAISFLREVMGRLAGADPTASPLFRLDTPFGGGKTHTLIALYHLATWRPVAPEVLGRLQLDPSLVPPEPLQVVGVTCDQDLDPANGVEKRGVRIHHLWGEIAFQLGGPEGYRLVEESDRRGQAPGPHFLERLIGDRPVLLLIDEPAPYMRAMGPAAGQLPVFLKVLADWIASSPRAVLVLTLAWDPERRTARGDAFAAENQELAEALERAFRETQSVVSRQAKVVTPAQATDIAPILRQRLFQQVDEWAAAAVAEAYFDALRRARDRGYPLPAAVVQASYHKRLRSSYPFHPSLIEVLDGKLATIPNFQRTRGALRLLAKAIRRLWATTADQDLLVHPFSVDLADPDIVDELTGRLDKAAFRSVVAYDIARPDGEAHAQAVDRERFAGHPPYAGRVANTVFLHSLTEPPARGVDLDELLAATLTPEDDPAHLQKALEYLLNEAWHLDFEGRRYAFRTEPSLNKVVLDETEATPLHDARSEVERRIRQLWRDAGLRVVTFPTEPADVEDEARGRLVVLHWDTASFREAEGAVPDRVRELWEYAGVQRGYRRFRNTIFFLVADADCRERMVSQARRYLALDRLLRDPRRLEEYRLSREHRQRLDEWRREANLNVRVAITSAYCHLFYPVGEADSPYRPFAHERLHIEDQGDTRANHTETLLRRLRELNKVKSAEDAPMAPALVRRDAFSKDEGMVTLQSLFERFAERVRLPLLLEPTYLKEVVRLGIRNRVWLYCDLAANLAYDSDQDLPDIVIDARHAVALPSEVEARGIPIYRREPPPRERPKAADEAVTPRGLGPVALGRLEAHGDPGLALAELEARARDARWPALGQIEVFWQGTGADTQARLSALRNVLGHLARATAAVEVELSAAFPDGGQWETQFSGPAGRYRSLAPTLEAQAGEASQAHVNITLRLTFPSGLAVGGPDYRDLREVLDLAGLGRIRLTASRHEGGGQ